MQNILLLTKGHPFEKDAFFSIFDANPDIQWTHVEQPAAQVFFDPGHAAPYDVIVCYDMPGLLFHDAVGRGPDFLPPPPAMIEGFRALQAAGKGFVFLHHALAGWPAWPEYGEAMGGRFLYLPDTVRGRPCPDSGYRHNQTFTVRRAGAHPVLDGIPDQFEITDELYLAEIFESDVIPLLRADYAFEAANFHSAALAVVEKKMFSNEGWQHPPGSNLIGWAKRAGNSPVVYLQSGDSLSAYANPHYRRLIANAIRWVASPEAREWARNAAEPPPSA